MKKTVIGLALFLALISLACAASLPATESGLSNGSADKTIGTRQANWDAAQTDQWVVAWLRIPAGSDTENGLVRYQYKVTYTSPDQTGVVTEGPFNFDSIGYAKVSKQVSFFDKIKTGFSPQPNEGKWQIRFTLVDKGDKNKETPGARLTFNLTGSDAAQKPAKPITLAAATPTTTSTTTTSLANMALADPKPATTEAKSKKKAKKAKKSYLVTGEAEKKL